jgi:uncharacterized protein (TIGR03435 family)
MVLSSMIGVAYDVQDDQVIGPDWIRTSRFDVLAKTPNNLPVALDGPDSIRPMVRALLEERFKLAAHHETRPLPRYALVMARWDGRLGPQLRRPTVDCEAPTVPPQQEARPTCGARMMPGNVVARSVPVSQLAPMLLPWVQRAVVDRTGLTGRFDIDLSWTPDQPPQGTSPLGAPAAAPTDPNGPSIFTALQKQLGLKLVSMDVPLDLVVIDHVEQLIEN